MIIKEFNYLPEESKFIRNEVFVTEQGFVNEFDVIDDISTHLVMYDEDIPVATCRIFYDEEKKSNVVGRIAVIKSYRGKHLGAKILNAAEKVVERHNGNSIMLSAQVRVSDFYKKQGYKTYGEAYLDEDCPHICMKKSLGEN